MVSPTAGAGIRLGDTGLWHFGARDYDPNIGHGTAKDPSGFAGGTGLYLYAENDPVNMIDVDGNNPFLIGLAVTEVVSAAIDIATQYYAHHQSNTCVPFQINWASVGFEVAVGVVMHVTVAGVFAVAGRAINAVRAWRAARATRGATQTAARFDPSRAGHIFREAADPGHVNPASAGSQARFAQLFENVASNPANFRADAVQAGLITQDAAEAGVQAFTWAGRAGQVWVTVRNGVIQHAGVDPLGAFR